MRHALAPFQTLVALAPIAATLLDPFQAAIGIGCFVRLILIVAGFHARLTWLFIGIGWCNGGGKDGRAWRRRRGRRHRRGFLERIDGRRRDCRRRDDRRRRWSGDGRRRWRRNGGSRSRGWRRGDNGRGCRRPNYLGRRRRWPRRGRGRL